MAERTHSQQNPPDLGFKAMCISHASIFPVHPAPRLLGFTCFGLHLRGEAHTSPTRRTRCAALVSVLGRTCFGRHLHGEACTTPKQPTCFGLHGHVDRAVAPAVPLLLDQVAALAELICAPHPPRQQRLQKWHPTP
eukprot:1813534-Rhodomonas_salina.1